MNLDVHVLAGVDAPAAYQRTVNPKETVPKLSSLPDGACCEPSSSRHIAAG